MTRAEKIKNMTDEELVGFLLRISDSCNAGYCEHCPMKLYAKCNKEGIRKWLEEEVDVMQVKTSDCEKRCRMNEQEALKLGKALYDNITSNSNNIIPTKDYIKYVAKANEALEKQVAKKPNRKPNHNWIYEEITCPVCGYYISEGEHYCRCGQKLDWS